MSKKLFYILLCVVIAFAVIAGALVILKLTQTGGSDPAQAVWGYEKAAMLYDAGGMMKYSSEYNKAVLNRTNPTDKPVGDYYEGLYKDKISIYEEKGLSCTASEYIYYDKNSEEYASLLEDYLTLVPEADVEQFCAFSLNVFYNGIKKFTYPAAAVKTGGQWYFYKFYDTDS